MNLYFKAGTTWQLVSLYDHPSFGYEEKELVEPSEILFVLDGNVCRGMSNWTWSDWIESDYNTGNQYAPDGRYYIIGDTVIASGQGFFVWDGNLTVQKTDKLLDGKEYTVGAI